MAKSNNSTKVYSLQVVGAAKYFAAYDQENGKPCVWMQAPGEDFATVIDTAKTIELAKKKAAKWQEKENKAVIKSSYKK